MTTSHRRSLTSRPTSAGLAAAFDALDAAPLDQPLPHRAQEDIIQQAQRGERSSPAPHPHDFVRVTVRVSGPRYV